MKTKNYLKNRLTFGLEFKTKAKQKMVVKKIITEKITWKIWFLQWLAIKQIAKFHVMTIIIRSVFEEDGKLYPYLFLEKNDFSEGIDVNKTSLSEECMLCHYW